MQAEQGYALMDASSSGLPGPLPVIFGAGTMEGKRLPCLMEILSGAALEIVNAAAYEIADDAEGGVGGFCNTSRLEWWANGKWLLKVGCIFDPSLPLRIFVRSIFVHHNVKLETNGLRIPMII